MRETDGDPPGTGDWSAMAQRAGLGRKDATTQTVPTLGGWRALRLPRGGTKNREARFVPFLRKGGDGLRRCVRQPPRVAFCPGGARLGCRTQTLGCRCVLLRPTGGLRPPKRLATAADGLRPCVRVRPTAVAPTQGRPRRRSASGSASAAVGLLGSFLFGVVGAVLADDERRAPFARRGPLSPLYKDAFAA